MSTPNNGVDQTATIPELVPEIPSELPDALEPADLESLRFMADAKDKQAQMAQAAQVGLSLFQGHVSTKYKLKQGDGLDLTTGAITRFSG